MRHGDSGRDITRDPGDLAIDGQQRPAEDRNALDGRVTDRSRDGLGERLANLPAGHPSSPADAFATPIAHATDVSYREPLIASSRDSRPVPKATDAEWDHWRNGVRDDLTKADEAQLETKKLYTVDPDQKIWTVERNRAQRDLVNDLYREADDVPCDGHAIIAGGLPGSGKSTVLDKHAGIDRSNYLMINPDSIKEEMARRDMIPTVGDLSPMEASHLAHEESSLIAKRLAIRAIADRKNLIWDITMSSRTTTEKRINELHQAGYSVDGIFVDIPVETSVRRADARHREGHDDYRAGIGLGGRYVPPEVIRSLADPDWGSKNRGVFESQKEQFGGWLHFDNSVDDATPVLADCKIPSDASREEVTP